MTSPAPANGIKSTRTRERILEAAAQVLSRNGYAGTRLSDIAEVAELQAPAMYYYFPSRDDLIEEVMRVGIVRTRLHVEEALETLGADADPMDRLMAAIEAHLRFTLQSSAFATAATRNGGQVPPAIRATQLAEQQLYADVWRRLFNAARGADRLRQDVDDSAARMLILGALNWAPEWWHPGRGSLDAVIKTAQAIARDGLAKTTAPVRAPRGRRRPT